MARRKRNAPSSSCRLRWYLMFFRHLSTAPTPLYACLLCPWVINLLGISVLMSSARLVQMPEERVAVEYTSRRLSTRKSMQRTVFYKLIPLWLTGLVELGEANRSLTLDFSVQPPRGSISILMQRIDIPPNIFSIPQTTGHMDGRPTPSIIHLVSNCCTTRNMKVLLRLRLSTYARHTLASTKLIYAFGTFATKAPVTPFPPPLVTMCSLDPNVSFHTHLLVSLLSSCPRSTLSSPVSQFVDKFWTLLILPRDLGSPFRDFSTLKYFLRKSGPVVFKSLVLLVRTPVRISKWTPSCFFYSSSAS